MWRFVPCLCGDERRGHMRFKMRFFLLYKSSPTLQNKSQSFSAVDAKLQSLFSLFFFFFSFNVWLGSFHPSLILLNLSFPNMSQRRTRRVNRINGKPREINSEVEVVFLSSGCQENFTQTFEMLQRTHVIIASCRLNQGHQIFEN